MSGKIEELEKRISELTFLVFELSEKNKELNIDLMRSRAEFSDADDTLRRWRTELEIVSSKTDHNGCHIWIPELLKRTLGHTGNFLDPDKMTPEQFGEGCGAYFGDRYPNCGIRLVLVKSENK